MKTKPWSDIDLDNWKEYDEIITDSLWFFDRRNSLEKLDFHGAFIPQVATQLILRFSKSDETVLDPFIGSGTTAMCCDVFGRKCIGFDLDPGAISKIKQSPYYLRGLSPSSIRVYALDSADPIGYKGIFAIPSSESKQAHLAILHPPYHDIIRFTGNRRDLSNTPSLDAFLDLFEQVALNAYQVLVPGRFAALVIGDKYEKGELIPLGFRCMERMNRVGFKTKAIVIKNIEGNEKGKGKDANLWRYRALAGGFYVFKHEYIMLFQKNDK